jgi:BirA family transcriptional regulator, biotin operon repressor / biotin---[acetyl-CoA-carboxylase] ligase
VQLAQRSVADGYRLEVFDRLGSTNDIAMARAGAGAIGKLWIVAHAQEAGRGRLGRVWLSPPGNLYASLLLIDPALPDAAPQLGFVAGVALVRALRRLVPIMPPILLKWPNDALWRGAKLSGLIVEGVRLANGQFACVIGIGVNCTSHPSSLSRAATDLSTIAERPVSAADVLLAISDELPQALALWCRGIGFETIRDQWLSLAGGVGETVRADTGNQTYEGVFQTIDSRGRLVLATSSGLVTLAAGEVFLSGRTRPRHPMKGKLATHDQ